MSVVLSSISGKTREATVKIADETVAFTYKPHAISLGMSMALAEGDEQMIDVLAQVLDGWDVVEKEDEPFPPTAENLMKVPIELAVQIAKKITSGEEETEGEGGGSFGGG